MCTLTIIPITRQGAHLPAFRVVTNRDEIRSRPLALPPRVHELAGGRAVWPVDALAGGAWIGVNDRALVLALLNLNLCDPPGLPPPHRLVSRGRLIPALGDVESAEDAFSALRDLRLGDFAPFRLVAIDASRIVEARWDRASLEVRRRPLAPACFVSSGLGDHLVAPRLALFERLLAEGAPDAHEQDVFHRHCWPDRPEISVLMTRADARTVSMTVVEVRCADHPSDVVMDYCADSVRTRIVLPLAEACAGPAACEPRRC